LVDDLDFTTIYINLLNLKTDLKNTLKSFYKVSNTELKRLKTAIEFLKHDSFTNSIKFVRLVLN